MNPYDIEQAFIEIEKGIIERMIANFRRYKAKGSQGKYQWQEWRLQQLQAIGVFRKAIQSKYLKKYQKLNEWIKWLIGEAWETQMADSIAEAVRTTGADPEFFSINRTRMEALREATINDLARAESAVFRKSEDAYRQIIYKAQVALNSGMVTYEQAVDMATKDFIASGINCIEYSNGSLHSVQEYAKMVLRTTLKRAGLMAEGEMRTQLGVHTVYARWREEACPHCMRFLGRIMVDDVYSQGTKEEAELGGYLLLSEAMADGFLHPNCKDTIQTYNPNTWKDDPDNDPLRKTATRKEMHDAKVREGYEESYYRADQNAKRYRRLAENALDPANKKKYKAKAKEWQEKATQIYRHYTS